MSRTRERLRQAALELFSTRGYQATSIADIESAAGLSPRTGGFYRHFESKAELAAEIGETSIIETAADLGLDGVLPLGDTRAELVLIAKGFQRAHARQSPLAALIAELQSVPEIVSLQDRVDRELTDLLLDWLSAKPYAHGADRPVLLALLLSVLGGWIFFLSKQDSAARTPRLTDHSMLELWSEFWAQVLESSPQKESTDSGP